MQLYKDIVNDKSSLEKAYLGPENLRLTDVLFAGNDMAKVAQPVNQQTPNFCTQIHH